MRTTSDPEEFRDYDSRLRIAVCDDEPTERDQLAETLERVLSGRSAQIEVFSSADDLLRSPTSFHLIFLDILMEGKNGMEAAREIRQSQDEAIIVFVTSSRDYAIAGYEVDAFRYILKPYSENDVRKAAEQACARIDRQGLVVRSENALHRLSLHSVVSVEARAHRCVIRLTDGRELTVNEGISRLENRIPPGRLMRCHKSYIVNLEHIARMKRYDAIMKDGSLVPVGRQLWRDVQDRLVNYLSF